MLARLGSFTFELDTAAYDKLTRTTKYKWAKQNRFSQRPAHQFTGIGDDEISISGTIYTEHRGGLKQLDRMRNIAGSGEKLKLVVGYGNVGEALGEWVINSITEAQSYFHNNGQPRKQTFKMDISRYG